MSDWEAMSIALAGIIVFAILGLGPWLFIEMGF